MSDGETSDVEVSGPPLFAPGEKVKALRDIRNDGSMWGRRVGDILIRAGEIGYVRGIGEFLQRYYIYDVDFFERGQIVGMRGHELARVED
jgi:nitrogen fixation protein NifZ